MPEQELLTAACTFGTTRFNKVNNNTTTNNNLRITTIMSSIAAEMLEGKQANIFSFFGTMQARARLRAGKGQDKEGTTNEMILSLPTTPLYKSTYGSYNYTLNQTNNTHSNGRT